MKRKFSKNTCDALIFSEVAGLKPEILLKNDLLTAWKYPDTEFFLNLDWMQKIRTRKNPVVGHFSRSIFKCIFQIFYADFFLYTIIFNKFRNTYLLEHS